MKTRTITVVRYGDDHPEDVDVVWRGYADVDNGDGMERVQAVLAVDRRGRDIAAVRLAGQWVDAMGLWTTRDWYPDMSPDLARRANNAIRGVVPDDDDDD